MVGSVVSQLGGVDILINAAATVNPADFLALDEARWEMNFLLAMQVPEGKHIKVAVGPQPWNAPLVFTEIDASGMAHHKAADRAFRRDGDRIAAGV